MVFVGVFEDHIFRRKASLKKAVLWFPRKRATLRMVSSCLGLRLTVEQSPQTGRAPNRLLCGHQDLTPQVVSVHLATAAKPRFSPGTLPSRGLVCRSPQPIVGPPTIPTAMPGLHDLCLVSLLSFLFMAKLRQHPLT